jgi:hypothetical protein
VVPPILFSFASGLISPSSPQSENIKNLFALGSNEALVKSCEFWVSGHAEPLYHNVLVQNDHELHVPRQPPPSAPITCGRFCAGVVLMKAWI